jgi:hypothetical protein
MEPVVEPTLNEVEGNSQKPLLLSTLVYWMLPVNLEESVAPKS